MVVRGVSHRIAKDAWWLDDADPPTGLRVGPVLILALVLADVLVWGVRPGFGVALWMLAIGAAITLTVCHRLEPRRLAKASVILFLAILPLVEVVQFGTVMVALLGLLIFGVMVADAKVDAGALWRAVARVPGYGLAQTVRDALAVRVATPSKGSLRGVLFDWGLPFAVGGVFLVLMVAANPILDRWLVRFADFELDFLPQTGRVVFLGFAALTVWPLLRLTAMMPALTRHKPSRIGALRSGFLNERSVLRALVTFNIIFMVQTTLDMGILWGGVALPEGMTYANYAHRGAYPLLATALMAGVFALMAQPYLGIGRAVRMLLYLWIAQTVILVISSILRLDLYVDVYGLTRLRFAAVVWMVVVALGLVLIIMQMVGRHAVGWFLQRAFGLGLLAIYICNLINIDGYIARNNLADDRPYDSYLCDLSKGAVPAIRAHEVATGEQTCVVRNTRLSQRDDWREWGYRNARLHRSLTEMETNR